MDFPYAIEGGSTKKNFWVLNKVYMAKREGFTHETEKDKTRNVLLGMTKLGI